jgi:uncharacterized protein YjbI with pentapeptide repeats
MKSATGPKLDLPAILDDYTAGLDDRLSLDGVRMVGTQMVGVKAKSVEIKNSSLQKLNLSESRLKQLSLEAVELQECLLYGGDLDSSGWQRVIVAGSVLSGIALTACKLEDVVFENCKLDLANFRFTELKTVTFKNCNMRETDFYEAKLGSVKFENCDLTKSNFFQAKLRQVDLRGAELSEIKGISGLRGAKINPVQLMGLAPVLAAEVGIEVSED